MDRSSIGRIASNWTLLHTTVELTLTSVLQLIPILLDCERATHIAKFLSQKCPLKLELGFGNSKSSERNIRNHTDLEELCHTLSACSSFGEVSCSVTPITKLRSATKENHHKPPRNCHQRHPKIVASCSARRHHRIFPSFSMEKWSCNLQHYNKPTQAPTILW